MSQRFYVYFLINKYLHHYLYFCAKLLNSAKKCTPYSFGNIYLSKKCPKTHQGLELLFALSLDISRFYCTAKKNSFPLHPSQTHIFRCPLKKSLSRILHFCPIFSLIFKKIGNNFIFM